MGWMIPNLDPYTNYFLKEVGRWAADNAATIFIILYVLDWLSHKAEKLEAVTDNTRLSMLGYYLLLVSKCGLYVFSFKWLTQFRGGVQTITTETKSSTTTTTDGSSLPDTTGVADSTVTTHTETKP
jgi:hypothetical protein